MPVHQDYMISIIIPTYNSEKTIRFILDSIKKQTYQNYEIIIVDKNSTDKTASIAMEYNCRIIYEPGLINVARNAGAHEAKGEYLLHIDSDHELEPDVLKECNEMANKGVKIAEIPELVLAEGFWGKCRQLEALCYIGDDSIESPRFIDKKLFDEFGGFITGDAEDWDLRERMFKKGYKLERTASHKLHHEGRVKLFRRLRKKFIFTGHIKSYLQRNTRAAISQIPLFRKAFFKNWKLLLSHPILAAGMFTMKFLETLIYAAGITYHRFVKQKKRRW